MSRMMFSKSRISGHDRSWVYPRRSSIKREISAEITPPRIRDLVDLPLSSTQASVLDPQYLYGSSYGLELKKELKLEPGAVDVLEVDKLANDQIRSELKSLTQNELIIWLQRINQPDEDEIEIRPQLRLVLGRSATSKSSADLPSTFPNQEEDIVIDQQMHVPFSNEALGSIIRDLHLPSTTPWLIYTDHSHFERHAAYSKTYIGYTMRRPTWGVLAMNISLSLSYNIATGITCGLLLGCSENQQLYIIEQIKGLANLTFHPLLLPVLFSAHQRQLLHQDTRRIWLSLLGIEKASGQTGLPTMRNFGSTVDPEDYAGITKITLGVMQTASGWQSTLKDIILGIDAIKDSLLHLNSITEKRCVHASWEESISLFEEWLRFTMHQSKVLMGQLEYIDKRGQAQMTAVYNYIAQKDTKYSIELAADSKQISAASKRDSSAMKGIAVLTMIFLPGTFMATFFAMPVFDFTVHGRPTVREPGFWIYWTVTVPLTVTVLCIYISYLLWIQRKHREEDENAQREVRTSSTIKFPYEVRSRQSGLPHLRIQDEENSFVPRYIEHDDDENSHAHVGSLSPEYMRKSTTGPVVKGVLAARMSRSYHM